MRELMRTLGILLRKEMWLMRRNPFIPRIIVMLPVMGMLVLPLVANFDVKNVGVAIVDNDRSMLSRRIIADCEASEYLAVKGCFHRYADAMQQIEDGDANVILSIPCDYEKKISKGMEPVLDVAANGVDAISGMIGARYASQSAVATLGVWCAEQGVEGGGANVNVLNLYNPTLDFRNYMIPALIVILIIIICGFLPALNIVREKETGTIEAMNVTPVGRVAFVLSKLIPYWVVCMMVVTVGMLIGRLVYGLSPAGSIGAVYAASLLFGLVMSGIGVTIANKSATMQQSVFVMLAVVMIFNLMSGLFTPVSSMPPWAQYLTYANPPRYFIEIMRGVYLRGAGMEDLAVHYLALAGFAVTGCVSAAMTYSKRNSA